LKVGNTNSISMVNYSMLHTFISRENIKQYFVFSVAVRVCSCSPSLVLSRVLVPLPLHCIGVLRRYEMIFCLMFSISSQFYCYWQLSHPISQYMYIILFMYIYLFILLFLLRHG